MQNNRDKLIELLEEAKIKAQDTIGSMNNGFGAWYADYLIEHSDGVIVLPCKVGDQVFVVYGHEIQRTSVFSIKIESEDDHFVFIIKCIVEQGGARFEKFLFGKTVFLNREEVEKALEKRSKDKEWIGEN